MVAAVHRAVGDQIARIPQIAEFSPTNESDIAA